MRSIYLLVATVVVVAVHYHCHYLFLFLAVKYPVPVPYKEPVYVPVKDGYGGGYDSYSAASSFGGDFDGGSDSGYHGPGDYDQVDDLGGNDDYANDAAYRS